VDPAIDRRVTEILESSPVVMFALEWCEFCWSVRKLFARAGIPYESVDLDSVSYQQDELGGRIRAVLADRTGQVTIPQIFIGGRHVGGCTETFDEFKQGRLGERLEAAGVEFDRNCRIDPYTLLPNWLHKRNVA
jgi:cysteine synthase A